MYRERELKSSAVNSRRRVDQPCPMKTSFHW